MSMEKTTIEEIRKVNTGEIEIGFEIEKECTSKDFGKPPTTRYYRRSLLIPKDRLKDLQKALDDKRW